LRTLVLLHGLGTGPSGWKPQLEAFPNAVAPKLDDADAAMDGLDEPFDLCGLSLGALVALRYAGDHRECVRRLVVCAGVAELPWHLRLAQRSIAGLVRVLPSARVRSGLVSGLPPEHRATALEEIGHIDARGASRTLRQAASFRLERLPTIPTLVLCGDRDRFNLKLSRTLAAKLTVARFEIVPDAGHVANLDNPDAFNALLRDFLGN
jgi:pimeloyl-ACP methyl ester carboxylesterase